MRLNHNSFTMTIWSQEDIQLLLITTTRTMFPFFKSVSPVFGLRQLSVKPGWLRHALLVQVRQLILFLYLQMRLILMTSVNQLAWVYHSNHSIPEDREEELSGSKIKNIYICKIRETKNRCMRHRNYYRDIFQRLLFLITWFSLSLKPSRQFLLKFTPIFYI